MIDFSAFYKVSYGMYIVAGGDQKSGNGFISNSVFQVTAEPSQFIVCCNKENYTSEFISKYGFFSISILSQDADSDLIGLFGYNSGKDKDKLAESKVEYTSNNVPVVLNDCLSYIECELVNTFDAGTHLMFLGKVISTKNISDSEPLTYDYYRKVKKGKAPKNAPTFIDDSKLNKNNNSTMSEVYKCPICGFEHAIADGDLKSGIDPNTPWEEIPEDYKCPLCGADKEDFYKL